MKRNLIANVTENSRNSSTLLILSLSCVSPSWVHSMLLLSMWWLCKLQVTGRAMFLWMKAPSVSTFGLVWVVYFWTCERDSIHVGEKGEVIPKKKIKVYNQARWPAVPVHQGRWQNHSTLLEFRDLERLTTTGAAWHCSLTCRAAPLAVWLLPPLGTNVPRTQGLQGSLWGPFLRSSSHIELWDVMRRASQRVSSLLLNCKKGFLESYYLFCILLMGTLKITSTDCVEEMDIFPCSSFFSSYLERIDSGKTDMPPLDW